MLLCEIWPGGSKVKHVFLNSTKVDHVQTKVKHGCRKSTMVHYILLFMVIVPNTQHMNNVTFDVHQGLCHIVMFCHILTFIIFLCLIVTFLHIYVTIWNSCFQSLSKGLQGFCNIAMLIKCHFLFRVYFLFWNINTLFSYFISLNFFEHDQNLSQ